MATVSELGLALRTLVINKATRTLGDPCMGHWTVQELLNGGYETHLMAAAIHELGSYSSFNLV
jgi:hypothetical protein